MNNEYAYAVSSIDLHDIAFEQEPRRKRRYAAAWMLLISGLLICMQVILYGGAGAWFYGIR